jgi:pimeloyl-ACP methyl ester carboxylesterase
MLPRLRGARRLASSSRVTSLAYEEVTLGDAPQRTAVMLHGLLGQARNWRTFARKLLEAAAAAGAPATRIILPDLRCHGNTAQSGESAPPGPHTLAAAAADLARLTASLGEPALLFGHSMGGKVALQYAAAGRPAGAPPLTVFTLDSVPGPRVGSDPHAVEAVLAAVASLPAVVPSRQFLTDALRGRVPPSIAAWLASSMVPMPGAPPTGPLRCSFDLAGARQMYDDYRRLECVLSPLPHSLCAALTHVRAACGACLSSRRRGRTCAWCARGAAPRGAAKRGSTWRSSRLKLQSACSHCPTPDTGCTWTRRTR